MIIIGLLVLILFALLWPGGLRLVLTCLFIVFLYALATVEETDGNKPAPQPQKHERRI